MDLSDEALIQNFQKSKDPTHFKSLVRRYEGRIYAAVLRLMGSAEEAEEVVQDTFMKMHQNIDKFRSHASFAAWIFRIAHNCCMDRLRLKQRRKIYSFWSFDPQSTPDKEERGEVRVVAQAADPCPNPAQMLDAAEQEQLIERCLKELPDSQRAVVILHDIEGFPYQDIAEITGATIGTVRSRLHYGRLKLRELLEPYFDQRDVARASR